MKASKQEPAERPHQVALSTAEIIALALWHSRECKAVVKRYGKACLESRSYFFTKMNARQMAQLHTVAKEQIEAHASRGKELLAIAKNKA